MIIIMIVTMTMMIIIIINTHVVNIAPDNNYNFQYFLLTTKTTMAIQRLVITR